METQDADAGPAARRPYPPRKCSSGLLTTAQARTVDAWRARLTDPRPVIPGGPRPRTSTSDILAAAVAELLAGSDPSPAEAAAYASRMAAARIAATSDDPAWRRYALADPPEHPDVTWAAPGWLAERADRLADAATGRARELALAGVPLPGIGRRAVSVSAIARMAIDAWTIDPAADAETRAVLADAAVYAGVVWCSRHHVEWHLPHDNLRTKTRRPRSRPGPGPETP